MPARPAGPRPADTPPRPDPRARGGGPGRRRTVQAVAAAGRGARARLNARPNRPGADPRHIPSFPPDRRRTFPHARIPPESDADARATPETGPESHWSLLHNYRGSGGRGQPFGSARVVTPDPAGARGVCTSQSVAECRSLWPIGRRPRMAGRAVPSGAASAADGSARTSGVRW